MGPRGEVLLGTTGTRAVRGETGALFEVDTSMLAPPRIEHGYRDSSAPPRVTEIRPALAVPSGDRIALLVPGLVLTLGVVTMIAAAVR